MELLSGIGKMISDAGQEVAGQTSKLAEKARITSKISGVEKRITKELMVLGKEYYKVHHKTGTHPSLQMVSDLRAELKALQEELTTLHGVRICPQCESQVGITSSFCQHCGNTMSRTEESQGTEETPSIDLSKVIYLEKDDYEE